MELNGEYRFDKLGDYQQPMLDALSRALPGAAADYAPLPNGGILLLVTWPGFEGRDESARENLVRDSIMASLKIDSFKYISGIKCWTPSEADEIKATTH